MVRFFRWLLPHRSIVVDNRIFRLHYKFTVPILVILGIVVLLYQCFGDPIDCTSNDVPLNLLDSYCWMHSTYSIEEAMSKKVGHEVPYPGVDIFNPGDRQIYHNFFQWVGFTLLIQAMFFYTPRYLWRCFESRKINHMISDINNTMYSPGERDASRNVLVNYFTHTLNRHTWYSLWYFSCEVLNAINVSVQICFINRSLVGKFSSFGVDAFRLIQWDWSTEENPMMRVFPRMVKCTLYKFGASGNVQKHDALCALNINALNEKIYVFLWFWFIILAILSCMSVVYKTVLYFSPSLRAKILMTRVSLAEKDNIDAILSKSNVGDWFLLDLICRNLNPRDFRDLVHDVALRNENKDSCTLRM